jgi:hypothetical protein
MDVWSARESNQKWTSSPSGKTPTPTSHLKRAKAEYAKVQWCSERTQAAGVKVLLVAFRVARTASASWHAACMTARFASQNTANDRSRFARQTLSRARCQRRV